MRKTIYKEDGLNGSPNSPTGYKYVGYDGETFSEKSGATVSAIGGDCCTEGTPFVGFDASDVVPRPIDGKVNFGITTSGNLATKSAVGVQQYFAPTGDIKVYKALLTQSGTDAPVATVLQNTLGGTLVWGYNNVGVYTATLSGTFIDEKWSLIQGSGNTSSLASLWAYRNTDNEIFVETYDLGNVGGGFNLVNDILTSQYIQIEVYP
jgi:hypothetical protein